MFPLLMAVLMPWLVIPAVPPKAPNVEADPRLIGGGPPTNGGPVVKDQGFGTAPATKALPNRSFAPVVTVAVYWVFATRGLVGVNVAMSLAGAYVTVPVTGVAPGPVSVKVAELRVVGSIVLLNVEFTVALSWTPVAPFTGLVRVIAGGVVFAAVPVVKVQGFGTAPAFRALPAKSCAPLVTVAVYVVLGARFAVGMKSAVLPPAAYETAPATATPPGPVMVKVVPLIVAAFIAVLNVADTFWLMGTAVAAFAGIVKRIVGALAFVVVPVVKAHTKFAASAFPSALIAPVVIVAV